MGISHESTILILGETIGFWIQTGAIIISAIAAIIVIWWNGKAAKRRATIDLIISIQNDKEYNERYASVSYLIAQEVCLVNFADYLDDKHDELDNIRFVLNRLEFIAQGIRKKAFEEKIYKDLNYTNFTKLWKAVNPLIVEIRRRKNVDTYYQEMEWLFKKWEKNKLEKNI